MNYLKILGFLSLLLCCISAQAQKISGRVVESGVPLVGANVYTPDAHLGTTTDVDGYFTLELHDHDHEIVISFIGYESQTIDFNTSTKYSKTAFIEINLVPTTLDEVEVAAKKFDRSFVNPFNVQTIDSRKLTQAACCNLSESFETNAAIDVSFTDAVTGAKKIRMLGIDGYYTQTLFENSAGVRGLGNAYGMLFVPGPFMNSIAINKGSGSVVNGYESITGQINYEYKKPDDSERFFLNLFGSRHGQFEINTNFSHRLNENVSTMVLAHGMIHESIHDENHDGFQDVPLNERMVFMNRWKFVKGDVFRAQLIFNYVFDDRESGQLSQFFEDSSLERLYGIETVTRKYDVMAKTGFILKDPLQSIGVQYKYTHHEQDSWYGNRVYDATEDYGNVNFIFQTAMRTQPQTMKLGWSYTFDRFNENLDTIDISRTESVPGIFAEYSYNDNEKIALLIGMRADLHNIHGFWASPKLHFKYNFQDDFTMKISVGKAYRTANIIAENMGALASSRVFDIQENLGYESAWNAGIGLFKEFYLGFQPASVAIDYYRTDFTNQVVVDYEDPRIVAFYDLDGKSYSNSFQIESTVEAAKNLDITLAYKFDDVHHTYRSGLKRSPYIPLHKVLLNVNYETPNEKWRFDATGKFNSFGRLPSTESNPIEYTRDDKSKNFVTINAQATAVLKKWEFYIGGENITGFWQQNPIIAAENPFGRYFDASMIWGPLGGPRVYGGLRFTLPYKDKKIKQG